MREKYKMLLWLAFTLMVLGPMGVQAAWGTGGDSILLKDIEVLTLYNGKMTTGGRSSPVPQLECVKGGTAPCDSFRPRVVQCYNRGFDGVDVQWECKTDMDNAFRFGDVEVSCEGYSHRDDPYVLRGSCGLRYSIDYTKEGLNQKQGHNYYGSQDSGYSYSGYSGSSQQSTGRDTLSKASIFADIIVYVAIALMCWALYKTCISPSRQAGQDAYSTTNDDYPAGGGGGGYGWFGGQGGGHNPTAPPPPGDTDNASCRNRTGAAGGGGNAGAGAGGGGFWTGAAAGGLLGYMFGNRGNRNYGHYGGYQQPRYGGGGWGGGGWSSGGGGGFSGGGGGGGSTGTRSASGFGGTSRR